MSLPTTAAAVLVVVLGVLPGLPGDVVYRLMVGVSWREKEWRHLLRVLTFSLVGLSAYTLAAQLCGWYLPAYVVPRTFIAESFRVSQLPQLTLAYLGHFVSATSIGAAAALVMRGLGRVSPIAAQRDAWDQFVNVTVARHWVLVTLKNGDTYAGMLDHADVAVEPEFRDIILAEPFRHSAESGTYLPTMTQHLFLRGVDIGSIAAVYDQKLDERIVPVSGDPFRGEHNEREA